MLRARAGMTPRAFMLTLSMRVSNKGTLNPDTYLKSWFDYQCGDARSSSAAGTAHAALVRCLACPQCSSRDEGLHFPHSWDCPRYFSSTRPALMSVTGAADSYAHGSTVTVTAQLTALTNSAGAPSACHAVSGGRKAGHGRVQPRGGRYVHLSPATCRGCHGHHLV